ncbi:hypothetical protein DFH06DRAFT_1411188 [Mycena polygramma]|nr:hypothetical protein DFH06DRAFT_1411188 [Mycena polygramma]
MRFTLIPNVALLCVVSAHAHPNVLNDIHCAEDSHVGFVHNSYTFNAPLDTFTDVTKSFFDIKWYGGTVVTNTTGVDGVPGATRSGRFDDALYTDTLTMYSLRPDTFEFSYHGDAPTFTPAIRYAETMRFESICGGTATYIDVISSPLGRMISSTGCIWPLFLVFLRGWG